MQITVPGFLKSPKVDASGALYTGRLGLRNVQWTDESDLFGTVTVTLEQVADAAESRLLWTDQGVQRGMQPSAPSDTARELPVSDGYPDPSRYVFDAKNADAMAEKLLANDKLFSAPLCGICGQGRSRPTGTMSHHNFTSIRGSSTSPTLTTDIKPS